MFDKISHTATNQHWQSLDNVALFLGALTAGGGITGYVRTGSVPSVAAGVTVGALVRPTRFPHLGHRRHSDVYL